MTVSNHMVQVRQQAAVLARLRIVAYMNKFDVAAMDHIKELLLRRMLAEPSRPTRLAVCALTAAVAKSRLATWPELLAFIGTQARGAEEARREMALLLLSAVLEAASGTMTAFLPAAVPLIGSGLCDSSGIVQVQALRCCGQALMLVPYDADLSPFEPLVRPMMSVVHSCVSGRHEELASESFEALHQVVVAHPRLLLPHLAPLCTMLIGVVTTDAATPTTRDSASVLLMSLIGARPSAFAATGLLTPLVGSLLRCASEPEDDPIEVLREMMRAKDADLTGATAAGAATMGAAAARSAPHKADMVMPGTGIDRGDEPSPAEMACRVLNHLALHMPGKAYFEHVMAASDACLGNGDWNVRFVGLMLLRNSVEGLRTHFRANIPRVLAVVTRPLLAAPPDPSPAVITASLYTLAEIAQRMAQFLAPHTKVLVPPLLARIGGADMVVADMAAFALETLLDDDTRGVLDGQADRVMAATGALLTSAHASLRARGLGLLGSVAINLGPEFGRFLAPAMAVLMPLMAVTDPRGLEMRADATETIGNIANAVGRAAFAPVIGATDLAHRLSENFALAAAIASGAADPASALGLASSHLAERLLVCTFAFFSNMTPVLKADVLSLMPTLLSAIGDALQPAEATVRPGTDMVGPGSEALESAGSVPASLLADTGMVDEFADEEAPGPAAQDVHEGRDTMVVEVEDAEARAEAMRLLGTLMAVLGEAMAPHVDAGLALCRENLAFFEEDVREQAVMTLAFGVRCFARCEMAAGSKATPPPPKPAGCRALLLAPSMSRSERTEAVLGEAVQLMLQMASRDTEPEVAGAAIQAVNVTLRDFGAPAVGGRLTAVLAVVVDALQEKLQCQYPDEEGDLEDDGNMSHHVLEEVYDLLGSLCARGGPALWDAGFSAFWPVFAAFAAKPRHPLQQCGVVGCIGEITDGLGACPGYVAAACGTVLPIIGAAMASDDPMLRRNGLYTAGALLENTDACISPLLPRIMPALLGACARPADAEHAAVDNAIAATCRALKAHASEVDVPAAVAAVVGGLPLQEDQAENQRVWGTLLELAEAGEATTLAATARLVPLAATEMEAHSPVSAACRALMLRTIVALGRRNAAGTTAAIATLAPAAAASINERVTAAMAGADIVAAATSPTKAAVAAAAASPSSAGVGSPSA